MPRTEGNGAGVPRTSTRSAPKSRDARATRSKPGGARSKTTGRYTDADREGALELLRDGGVAHAHRQLGIPKATLSRWASAAGIDLDAGARARTEAAVVGRREQVERVRLSTVQLLEQHVERAGEYLSTIVGANAEAAYLIDALDDDQLLSSRAEDGTLIVTTNQTDARAAMHRAYALASLPLAARDAEGILTRAIHDLALLKGEATERGAIVIDLSGVPRPDPAAADAAVIPQAALTTGAP